MDLFGDDGAEEKEGDLNAGDREMSNDVDAVAGGLVRLKPARQSALCLGHEEAEQEILKLYNNKRMPHGLVFSGPEGIGKATFAFRLARFLLSRTEVDPSQDALFGGEAVSLDVAEDNPVFSRVASGGHSDLFTVERQVDERKGTVKSGVEVAEVRKVAPFLRKTAAEADWRVVIVDDADTMNINAQNALLKILEEPPERALLILITHRIGALIPTIRSRTQVFQFVPLAKDELKILLERQGHNLSDQEFSALVTLCQGSIGHALDLIENGGLDVMAKIVMMFAHYPRWKWPDIHTLAEDLGRAGQSASYDMFEHVMRWSAESLAKAKARGQDLPRGPLSLDVFETMKNTMSLEELVKICDNLKEHFESVRRANLEKRQAVMQAFSYFGA